jgi:hypothetical protein
MARRNTRASRGQQRTGAARWAGRRSRAVVTIRARRRDLARLRAEAAAHVQPGGADELPAHPGVCTQCSGKGQIDGIVCGMCEGTGNLQFLDSHGPS